MKEVLLVSIGSFFGGGMRYWISKMVQSCTIIAFPFGTMVVNILGCLIIGFLSGLNWNEGSSLMKEGNYTYMMLYLFGSLALGLIAVLAGHQLAKILG